MSDALPKRVRVLFLLSDPSDPRLTPEEALRIELRNRATMTGRCVCGARAPRPVMRAGEVTAFPIEHKQDCPYADVALLKAIMARIHDLPRMKPIEAEIDLGEHGAGDE